MHSNSGPQRLWLGLLDIKKNTPPLHESLYGGSTWRNLELPFVERVWSIRFVEGEAGSRRDIRLLSSLLHVVSNSQVGLQYT
jgi:hypothetical protein